MGKVKQSVTNGTYARWQRYESIQWGCLLMELLGEHTLDYLPLLLSGSRAAETSYQTVAHRLAIRQTRDLVGPLFTRRAVQKAARDLQAQAAKQACDPSYHIDPQTLLFERAPGQTARLAEATAYLTTPLPRSRHGLRPVLMPGDAIVRLRENTAPVTIALRLPALPLPAPVQHDLQRRPDAQLTVTWAALRATAQRLDATDEVNRAHWKPENWVARLDKICLQASYATGLQETEVLDLRGLQHLIGLPGAGKTTLISLLCAHLAELDKQVAVFFTSIETARGYLEKLTRYQVKTALLVGRSAETHRRHSDNLAELIATQGHAGLGETRTGTDLLAQTCPLPAFAIDEAAAWAEWRPLEAPCESLYEPDSPKTRRLCPLWSQCGRVKNQRQLVTANIWLGHVRSADTAVPPHSSPERMQYFELLGTTFDLVIVDEVDESQAVLDELGALTLELGGTPESIHIQAQRVTGQALTGGLPFRDQQLLYPHNYAANTFERHLIRFYEEISRLEGPARRDLENQLLTTNYLIRAAVLATHPALTGEHRSAIYAFWDSALYTAFFRDKRPWTQAEDLANALGLDAAEARARWQQLVQAFGDYLHALADEDEVEEALRVLTDQFAHLIAPARHEELVPWARLLVAVGFTVAAYQKLARITRPLAYYGILPEAVVNSDASAALRQLVPRSLLGTFSSVRFHEREDRSGIVMDYLVLDSTPRLLLHRLHELGTNVLLASATSWMPDSSAYHVGVTPTYVLSPRPQALIDVKLRCLPIHPSGRAEALRFSGGGRQQLENLGLMVESLAMKRLSGQSALERSARALRTPSGRDRKCALVVNSYAQVQLVVRQIARTNSALATRTRGVVKRLPEGAGLAERYVLRGQVETLGYDDDALIVVFPLTALGRGVNIVFSTDDDDDGAAALGSIYFLTRPHPVVGDLKLLLSSIARETELFDQQVYPSSSLQDIHEQYRLARQALYARVMRLLTRPQSVSLLPTDFLAPFSANLFIPVLQTIGRAIRKGRPAEVYFVDAAWAPHSAKGEADTEKSSVLVTMRRLLRQYLNDPDPARRAVLLALYGPFARAFEDIEQLQTDETLSTDEDQDEFFTSSPLDDEAGEVD
jgi:hypothetical protein